MRPTFDAAGIRIVTVSTDTASEVKLGPALCGRKATMLAAPKLKVIEQIGYRNKNINNFEIPGRPKLSVPTSLLVVSEGTVAWKDQADNTTWQSDPEIVGAALAQHVASGVLRRPIPFS